MIDKLNFIYNEPAALGSGYMATRGLAEAFKRIGVLHYAYNTTGKEFLDQEALRAYPIFYIRGFLPGRGPMVVAGGDQFKATLQSESFFTRHGKLDGSSTHIREREGLFDVMFTLAETDVNLYRIPTFWCPSWADTTVLGDFARPISTALGFIGGIPGREDWFSQDKKGIVKHMQTELDNDPFVNAQRYTEAINRFEILVAPPGRMFNSMTGRPFEIMACNRLCLSYRNKDTMFKHLELFEEDVDIVYWETFDEMVAKYEFYRDHTEERLRIARNGYNKVRSLHNQDIRARFFADIVLRMANEKANKGQELCLTK